MRVWNTRPVQASGAVQVQLRKGGKKERSQTRGDGGCPLLTKARGKGGGGGGRRRRGGGGRRRTARKRTIRRIYYTEESSLHVLTTLRPVCSLVVRWVLSMSALHSQSRRHLSLSLSLYPFTLVSSSIIRTESLGTLKTTYSSKKSCQNSSWSAAMFTNCHCNEGVQAD